MKNECKIIQDILPLYAENIANDETKAFVEDHLEGCGDCRKQLNNLKEIPEISDKLGHGPLKNLKKKLLKKRIAIIIFTSAIVLAIVITGLAFLTSPKYLPYDNDLLTMTDAGNGMVICSFNSEVTGYSIYSYLDEDSKTAIYHISAWQTTWDEFFSEKSKQNIIIEPIDGESLAVYYCLNNKEEDILIYGAPPIENSGVTSLPRLALSYYLTMAVFAAIILTVLFLTFRKKPKFKLWIEKLLMFPISYIISHLCIKGFSSITYSLQRDFFIILLVAILIYLAILLGMSLYRARKEGKN